MAKGIRVNQLAKELGVESKSILAKLRDEGLGEKAPNHMSLLPLGLAESVREWFSAGAGGTAVETAAPVEVATKVKRTRKKTGTDAASDEGGSDDHLDAGGDHVTTDVEAPVEPEAAPAVAEAPTPVVEAPAPVEPAPAEAVPAPVGTATPEIKPAVDSPVVIEAPVTPAPVAPPAAAPTPTPAPAPAVAAEAPAPAPAQPEVPHPPRHENRQVPRPTVTLADRPGGASVVERRPVVPQARLVTPEPARIQGPRVVREEKPEVVPAPRPRRPLPGQGTDSPAFSPTRPQGGRGVRVADEDEEKKKAGAKAGAKGTLSSRRRGPDGRRGEAMEKLKEYTEADLIERRERLSGAAGYRAGVNSHLKQRDRHFGPSKTIVQKGEPVSIEEPITVKTLSASLGIKANDIIRMLMRQGTMATINQTLSADVASTIAMEYNIELVIKEQATLEEVLKQEFLDRPIEEDKLALRPPVVTILGHVDHGKTSLLDKIRSANVAAGESGGITQHTAAWMVQLGDRKVTFIDTPGHQAFTSMRARGANMTDVVVLVVSAAEGVQPQTIESINHAKAAGVPIVVAMNKIDRPDTNEQQVLGQLAQNELNPVEWGGDTEVIRTSAHTGQGIEDLLEILHYQAELLDLKADPTAPATGTVIESSISEGLGAVATVLVQNGTLKVGDIVLCGAGHGRVRSLVNDLGKQIPEAGPSTPVIISGLDVSPNSGDHFYVLDDMDRARAIAAERKQISRQETLSTKTQVTLENVFATMKEGQIKTINLIIKGDVQGSIETLAKTVTDFNTEEVRVRVIHSAVGGISESDVELADASGAVIIGFHVVPDDSARSMAEQRRVEVRLYSVIYEIFDDLKKAMSGMLEPEIREKMHGHAEVRNVIKISRIGNVAGCMVTDGHIQRGSKIRLIRNNIVITEDIAIESLRRVKDDVREVKSGLECGIKLSGYDDVKIGDVFEAYVRETIERTL